MVTHYDYLINILEKILISYNNLVNLKDKPGNLDTIKREISRINGFFHVLITKIETEKLQSSDLSDLKSKFEYYLEHYSFDNEIETMALLYSDDISRLKNMRLKIIESLNENKLIDSVEYVVGV
jgi:hypothetical protein